MTDPPVHTAFRRLVARGFTPRQVAELEPAVRTFVIERLERLRAAGGGDIVAELFKPMPSMVVAHYLGVPDQDRPRFDEWTNAIVAANAARASGGSAGRRSDRRADGLLLGVDGAPPSERPPAEDTVSHLVRRPASGRPDDEAVGRDGDPGVRLHDGDRRQRHHTGLLGGTMELFATHPDQLEELADMPGLCRTPSRSCCG